ncbi:MAG TPA: O-antigen ligase family protein [Terriglobia bacterium]|nr:O-antigen ligase family protein [Terriglobia bacterium]
MIMITPAAATETLTPSADSGESCAVERSRAPSAMRWGLLAALLVAPLAFGAVQPWAWTGMLIAAFVLLLLWTISGAWQGALTIHWSPLYLPPTMLLALGIAQLYGRVTLDMYATREALLKLVMVLIYFFLAGQIFAEAEMTAWRELGLTVTLYAFALGIFAILQLFSSHNLIYWRVKSDGWIFGPYVNHNDYAGLMEMLLPISALYVLSRPRSDPRRLFVASSLCVPLTSVLLSGSRGGVVSVLIEVLTLGWILWRRSGGNGGSYSVMLSVVLAATVLFLWMAPKSAVTRLSGLADLKRATEVTLVQRKLATRDTLRIFRDHPFVGAGLGSFETVFPQYRTFPTDLYWAHAHNDYAEALADTGAAGAMLIIFALVIFFRLAFSGLDRKLHSETGWVRLGAAIGCCGLLVHSFVDFNLHIPANAAWFGVCAALGTTACAKAGARNRMRIMRIRQCRLVN